MRLIVKKREVRLVKFSHSTSACTVLVYILKADRLGCVFFSSRSAHAYPIMEEKDKTSHNKFPV